MNQTCKIHSVTHTYINENILTQICTHTCIEEYKISWGSGRMGEMKWGIWAGKAGKDPSFIHYGVGSVLYTERGGKFLSCWMGWAGLSIVMDGLTPFTKHQDKPTHLEPVIVTVPASPVLLLLYHCPITHHYGKRPYQHKKH